MPLKIAQLSDCHLKADPRSPYRGQDAVENLELVWEAASNWGPDIVLLSGDLSEDESEASYQRLASILQARVPILALPGNHDDPDLLRRYFSQGPWNGPLCFKAGKWCLILLDSTQRGKVEGAFSAAEIDGLADMLSACEQEHVLVALHHQPIPVQAAWIDRYPLRNPGPFLQLLDSDTRVRCVVWGHIHHHFAAERQGMLMLGAPSTAANSLPRSGRFEPDRSGPACRSLELGEDGTVIYGQLFGRSA